MLVIDAQVHVYERNHPSRPWLGDGYGVVAEIRGDQMVQHLDEVGVDAAILVSPWSNYRYDPSYALEVAAAYPGRFAVVAPFDADRPDVGEQVARWKQTPHAVGVRLMMHPSAEAERTGVDASRLFAAAQAHGLPICLACAGRLGEVTDIAANYPELVIVIDHLGLETTPEAPFGDLPELLNLARFPNVVVKATGVPTLGAWRYPFKEMWPALHAIFEAFTLERVMWGTDWTRATEVLTQREGLTAYTESGELSDSELAQLLNGTVQRVFNWSPSV